MDKFLNILDQKQEIEIDENKLKYMTSKIAIWDFLGYQVLNISSYLLKKSRKCSKNTMLKIY